MQRVDFLTLIAVLAVVATVVIWTPAGVQGNLCPSLDIRNKPANLNKLRNCTVVVGFVKILLFDTVDDERDFSDYEFPELTEIAEYLLFYSVKHLTSIGKLFPNLRIIRGIKLFHNHALIIFRMPHIQEIGLHNLYHIGRGRLKVDNCPKLCYVDTVDWKRIGVSRVDFTNVNYGICEPCDTMCNGYCWNARYCQDIATDHCHEECLGCTKENSAAHCKSCKNFEDNKICVQECPPHKYINYWSMRCVTSDECSTMLNSTWWVFQRECVRSCPRNFEQIDPVKGGCRYCGDKCVKICPGAVIDNIAMLDEMVGCTYINGSLEIRISDPDMNYLLEAKLGRITAIKDNLKIGRSTVLRTLHFLNNLTVIEGKELENQRYAVFIYENQNLQKLFNYSSPNYSLKILNGTIAFHDNPQLCLSEIEQLATLTGRYNDTDLDVFKYSNGDKSYCNTRDFNISVLENNPTNVTLSWQVRELTGNETIIGYTIYYAIAGKQNITEFDSKDVCDLTGWNSVFVSNHTRQLVNLTPYTRYGFYIKTYSTIMRGENTPIHYFTTATDEPTEPLYFQAKAINDSSIRLKWDLPEAFNGQLSYYNITVLMEKDSSRYLEQRNYCDNPHILDLEDFDGQRYETTTESPWTFNASNPSNCSCGAPKQEVRIFQKEIGALCRSDRESKDNSVCDQFLYRLDEFSFNSTNTPEEYYTSNKDGGDEFFTANKRSEKKTPKESDLYREILSYNVESTEYIIKKLRHFSVYIIFMKACNKKTSDLKEQCSPVVMATTRTLKNSEADDVSDLSVELRHRTAIVKWDKPLRPNAFVLAYQIEYQRKDLEHPKSTSECITSRQFLTAGNLHKIPDLSPGIYLVRVRATSLAGPGEYSEDVSFVIAAPGTSLTWLYVVLGLSVVFVALAMYGYRRYKYKHRLDNLQLIQSINPDYASPSYEEDEWEIDRNDIEIIKELGKGTFGLVYQGVIKSQNRLCAIKTATDSTSIADRMYFLNEGSVMKGFNDAYHVVKLIGIVSRGQPPLVVMELMDRGDLKSYLRRCREPSQNLTSNEMYRMAAEIADGMAYLAAKKYVHRDLAARNCMVSADRTVKIGDFGMARDIYETDYYRKETVGLLPVRWMAPESLSDGVFTTDSDVWSYGIVLWEMATLAEQPYQGMSNEEVFHFVKTKGKLERPNECSEVFFEVMDACWMWRPNDRPTFRDIVNKLVTHVGEDFRLVAFCFSRQGLEHALNAGPRVYNPPAMLVIPEEEPIIQYDAVEERVGLCMGEPSRPPLIFPFSSSNQRLNLSPKSVRPGSPHSPTFSLGSSP